MKKILTLTVAGLLCFNAVATNKNKQPQPVVAPSTVVLNQTSNQILVDNNADRVQSMASITKLMTAMVVLDHTTDLQKQIRLKAPWNGKRNYTVGELLDLALIRSDNHAAELLSKNFTSNRKEFISEMNRKALSLGMLSAQFVDPTGIGADNSATATDIARMVIAAGEYPFIRRSSNATMDLQSAAKGRPRIIQVNNTNKDILTEFDTIVVSKTGTTTRAGKCLAMLVEKAGQVYAVVILGEPNKIKRDNRARAIIQDSLTFKEVVSSL